MISLIYLVPAAILVVLLGVQFFTNRDKKMTTLIMFLLILDVMVIDFFVFGYTRDPGSIVAIGFIYLGYLVLFLLKNIIIDYEGDVSAAFKAMSLPVILSILQVGLPYFILEYVPKFLPSLAGWLFFLVIMFAPWIVYFLFLIPEEDQAVIFKWAKIIWVFVLVFLSFVLITPTILTSLQNIASTSSVDVKPEIAIDSFSGAISDQFDRIGEILNSTNQEYLPNQKGKIDKNRNARLGVFIKDLRTIPENILEDEEFYLLGNLEVNTIFNPILINTKCFIEKSSATKIPKRGSMTQNNFHVFGKNLEILECNFSGTEEGIYRAYFKSAFNFETWAYIDYTFVDKALAMNYYREGRDINKELGIEKETIPIYTDGPAKIMMIAANQPTSVDFESEVSTYPKIGISLQKNFLSGKIQKVNEIVLQVPEMIWIGGCTFKGIRETITDEVPEGFEGGNLDDYNYYRFRNNLTNLNPEALRTIVCNMLINEDEYLRQKSANSKLVKTIILKADYDYEVESDKRSVLIKDNPYED